MKTIAHARATVTIEIRHLGTWGRDCSMDRIYKQASEEALGRIRRMNEHSRNEGDIHAIGEPKITVVMVEETLEN